MPLYISEFYYIKKKYMKLRFGFLKSYILRSLQYKYFTKRIYELFRDYRYTKIKTITYIYDYLYSTKDIWTNTFPLADIIKNKLILFTEEEPLFKKYLIEFRYICPYIEKNIICGKMINGKLCSEHTKKKRRMNKIIYKNLH